MFTNLINYNSDLIFFIENDLRIDTDTDFSKDFDKVNHDMHTTKLQRFGLQGRFLD